MRPEPKTITFRFYKSVSNNIDRTIHDFRKLTTHCGHKDGPENWPMVRDDYNIIVGLRNDVDDLLMSIRYWGMDSYKRSHAVKPWYLILVCMMTNRMIRKKFGMDTSRNETIFGR